MKRSSFSYFLCYLNVFVAVVGALNHDLFLMLLGFFFGVFNWYVAGFQAAAELKRGSENEEDDNRESDDSDSSSTTEDDAEDEK